MSSWVWEGGGFGSESPDIVHNFRVQTDVNRAWTFTRAIVSYECTYEFLEDPTTPLGTWLPTVIAAYWRFGFLANSPRDLADGGGDYSEYRGMNWDDAVNAASVPDTTLHQFYAPRDGLPLDVQGSRRLGDHGTSENGFWISAGPSVTGTIAPAYFPRTFMMTGTVRALYFVP